MSLASLTVAEFLERLASSEPTPGGGSLAAVAGAMAAAMVSMVCNLTLGRPRFASVTLEIEQLLADAVSWRQRLLELAEADAEAYAAVRAAYQLPRTNEGEQQARASAVEQSMQRATQVPVESAESARAVLALALRAAQAGNPTVLPDVAVAAHLALGALRAAADQARYNCSALTHAAFAQEMRGRIGGALKGADVLASETLQWVERRVGS